MRKTTKKTTSLALAAVLACALLLCLSGCGAPAAGPAPTAQPTNAPVAPPDPPVAAAETSSAVPAEKPAEVRDTITVSASGTVRLVPDKATVTFGVTTQEATAELAQSKNSEKVKSVIEALTGRGVEEKSIRTTNYSMYPQYDWSDGGEQRLVGYSVNTTMTVRDQNIEDLGKLLSACVGAGINNVDSVSFLCSGYDAAYRDALAQAVAASREKAEALAAAAGKTLGDPTAITEGWQDTSARYGKSAEMPLAVNESAADAAAPAIQPGETEIIANVTVSYAMK